jgi:16S rRNA (guanine966-N2)-methyltransferase
MPERGRVIAGAARGIRLEVPPRGTRPLSDRVKQSLFAALESSRALDGPFLDLYAGSGAAGIEALSRGAPGATFVERDSSAARAIAANLDRTGLKPGARIVRAEVEKHLAAGLATTDDRFTAVLIDPPYDAPLVLPTLELLGEESLDWLAANATVVAKHFWRDQPPESVGRLRRDRQKRFGETCLSFYTREP